VSTVDGAWVALYRCLGGGQGEGGRRRVLDSSKKQRVHWTVAGSSVRVTAAASSQQKDGTSGTDRQTDRGEWQTLCP
jgi:hypothetical protein